MMKKLILAALLFSGCWSAFAVNGDPIRWGSHLIMVGDSEGKVHSVMGEPSRVVQLVNGFGAGVGEKWVYYDNRSSQNPRTVSIYISGGQVTNTEEQSSR